MSESTTQSYKFSDRVIAQIVQLIQLGILTGTDVSDQMRTLRVIAGDNHELQPCPAYMNVFNENMEKMMSLATVASSEEPETHE